MNARMVLAAQFALDTPPKNARVAVAVGEDSQQQRPTVANVNSMRAVIIGALDKRWMCISLSTMTD